MLLCFFFLFKMQHTQLAITFLYHIYIFIYLHLLYLYLHFIFQVRVSRIRQPFCMHYINIFIPLSMYHILLILQKAAANYCQNNKLSFLYFVILNNSIYKLILLCGCTSILGEHVILCNMDHILPLLIEFGCWIRSNLRIIYHPPTFPPLKKINTLEQQPPIKMNTIGLEVTFLFC